MKLTKRIALFFGLRKIDPNNITEYEDLWYYMYKMNHDKQQFERIHYRGIHFYFYRDGYGWSYRYTSVRRYYTLYDIKYQLSPNYPSYTIRKDKVEMNCQEENLVLPINEFNDFVDALVLERL